MFFISLTFVGMVIRR